MTGHDNPNPYPDGTRVVTRFPGPGQTAGTPREQWPWYPAYIECRGGPDEWKLTLTARELAVLADGTTPAPDGIPPDQLWWPQCFRTSCEILRVPEIRSSGHHAGAARPG